MDRPGCASSMPADSSSVVQPVRATIVGSATRQAASTKQRGESHGPALLVADGLADRVGITERENSNVRRWLCGLHHGFT